MAKIQRIEMPYNKGMQTDQQTATRFADRWCRALGFYELPEIPYDSNIDMSSSMDRSGS